jgi:LacI family transcriptional regulator
MALQQAGMALPQEYIRYGNWEYESGKEQTRELLKLDPLPDAVFAMNDLMAAGCMSTLVSAGFRIPEDIAVAGFDNREIASYLQPPLTTIALPTTEIGTDAAIRIIEMINNPSTQPVREILRCSIIERESV